MVSYFMGHLHKNNYDCEDIKGGINKYYIILNSWAGA